MIVVWKEEHALEVGEVGPEEAEQIRCEVHTASSRTLQCTMDVEYLEADDYLSSGVECVEAARVRTSVLPWVWMIPEVERHLLDGWTLLEALEMAISELEDCLERRPGMNLTPHLHAQALSRVLRELEGDDDT